jgi:glyoxylase-like metal-dependent hydrolase (beta-lactamase superfamily II)
MTGTTHSLTIGGVEIISMPDGAGPAGGPLDVPPKSDQGGQPDGQSSTERERWWALRDAYPEMFDEQHRWHIHNGCYLLRSQGRTILVDTGMGGRPYWRYGDIVGVLPRSFEQAGVALSDVDTVLMTHGHPDHVGWNVTPDGAAATFPRARYMLHEADWREFATLAKDGGRRDRIPNYVGRSLIPLERLGVLDRFDGEPALTDELRLLATPGHTPGHVSVLIASQGKRAVITGDVFSNQVYITEPDLEFTADFDVEEGKATRRTLLDRIEADGMTVVSGHFAEPGFGHLVQLEGRRYWRAL